ncbi:hypothetical protein [Roseicyclus mahoneyensis]|uniref:Uncharacterized protein n=1 Tax=Roseicyclus mahoneyensis TaxID=164332 RepID=A0A316GIX9_9RHOB|nr:hypothetical protein [Roseicyclus mahoneyensis]PWK61004.1 hypothetical protein C7455_103204 [Roseicyclus mahoneyensis]
MGDFLALLLAYYTCDAAAQGQQPLSHDRFACVETYEAVKDWFAPLDPSPMGTPEYGAERIATYRAFTAWEAANAELVAQLRAEARGE